MKEAVSETDDQGRSEDDKRIKGQIFQMEKDLGAESTRVVGCGDDSAQHHCAC